MKKVVWKNSPPPERKPHSPGAESRDSLTSESITLCLVLFFSRVYTKPPPCTHREFPPFFSPPQAENFGSIGPALVRVLEPTSPTTALFPARPEDIFHFWRLFYFFIFCLKKKWERKKSSGLVKKALKKKKNLMTKKWSNLEKKRRTLFMSRKT